TLASAAHGSREQRERRNQRDAGSKSFVHLKPFVIENGFGDCPLAGKALSIFGARTRHIGAQLDPGFETHGNPISIRTKPAKRATERNAAFDYPSPASRACDKFRPRTPGSAS